MGLTVTTVHAVPPAAPAPYVNVAQAFPPYAAPQTLPAGASGGSGGASSLPDPASLFTAACIVTDLVGSLVYARTDGSVRTADCYFPYIVVGVIVAKSSDTICTVQKYGPVAGAFTHMTPGRTQYVGSQGNVTQAPFPSYAVKFVQAVGQAVDPSTLFLQPSGSVLRRNTDNTQVGD